MSSIATVDRLLASWDQLIGQIDAPPAESILLACRDGSLQFERKPKKSFQDRILRLMKGEPQEENFPLQLELLNNIFNRCQDREKCARLADHVNAIGRYSFAKRTEKTFIPSKMPKLADYQIRTFLPTTCLIAPGPLKRGLPNQSLKLCWLNAALKFMAATTHYDALMTTRSQDSQLEAIRKALFRLVDALRRNWDQHLINALHQELIDILRQSAFGHFFTGEQQDATEFILQLKAHFPVQNAPQIELAVYYDKIDKIWKPGYLQATDKLTADVPHESFLFSLEEAYSPKSYLENVRDYYDEHEPNQSDSVRDFISHTAVTHYPQLVEVFIKRGETFDYIDEEGHECPPKIVFEEGGTLTVQEHSPELLGETDMIVGVHKGARCTLRAVAAIERTGGKNKQPHYVTHTRSRGTITTHNDARLIDKRTEAVWQNAYLLILERVQCQPTQEK